MTSKGNKCSPSPVGEGWGGVLLASGDFPTHPAPCSLLDHSHVICCDSAAETFIATGRTPYAVVGDGDSLSEHLKKSLRFIQIDDQETNDLTKAVMWAKDNILPDAQHKKLAIIGATGRREDHTLGNISLLIDYMRLGLDVQMVTDHGVFIPCHGTRAITPDDEWWLLRPTIVRQEISIFNFTCTAMTGEGLDYPLRPFTSWWQGTLNYVTSDRFTIHADGDYLLYLSFSFRK